MDTGEHVKTPETPGPAPASVVEAGKPVERPAGTVEVEWANMDVDSMLNKPGFAAFLENYGDSETFEMDEGNKKEIVERFRAFEASTTVARQLEVAMTQKLRAQGKGRMTIEEQKVCKEQIAELAVNDPDKLIELQNDLRVLEENPEKIRQKEAELSALKENWGAEQVKAGITELATKKADLGKALKEAEAVEFSRFQKAFFDNFGARFNKGKIAEHIERTKKVEAELAGVDADLKSAEEALASSPEILAHVEQQVAGVKARLVEAQERIFTENKAAKQIRERLISEVHKRCDDSLESTDITVLQKAAEQFAKDEKLAEEGSDYLDLATDPGFADEYKKKLSEKLEEAVIAGIAKTLETLPAGVTQSRLERALRTFTNLAGTEVGFTDKEASRDFMLEALAHAEKDARLKHKGSGKSVMLKHLIAKLSKTSVV